MYWNTGSLCHNTSDIIRRNSVMKHGERTLCLSGSLFRFCGQLAFKFWNSRETKAGCLFEVSLSLSNFKLIF
jgi:hypothetical protein